MAPPPLIQLKDIALTFGGTPLLTRRRAVGFRRRAGLPGRPQRVGQVDVAQDRRRADRSGQRHAVCAARREHPLSAAGARLCRLRRPRWPMSRPVSVPTMIRYQARYILRATGADRQARTRRNCPAAKRAVRRSQACWRRSPDILLLDEPTNHLDLAAIEWLEREARRPPHGAADDQPRPALPRPICRAAPSGSIADRRGASSAASPRSRTWRDEVLAEEERDQHKLDRKIVAEEHWLRYGVSARRKRNVKRLGNLHALREARRTYRGALGSATLDSGSGGQFRQAGHRSQGTSANPTRGSPIVGGFSTRIQRGDRIGIVGPNGSGKTTLANLLTGTLAPDSGSVRLGANLAMATLDQHRGQSRSRRDAGRSADRRPRRSCPGRRADTARDRLHEGLSVPAGAGAHAA